jgi:hypothetical protein
MRGSGARTPSAPGRRDRSRIRLLAGLPVRGLVAGLTPASTAARPHADELTASRDDLRTGSDRNEATPTSGSVAGGDSGQLLATRPDGRIHAQPLVVGHTLVAGDTLVGTTENDHAYFYGLNKVVGAIEWTDSLGPASTAWPAWAAGCGDLTPNVGAASSIGAPGMVGTYVVFDSSPTRYAAIETVASRAQAALTEGQTAQGIPDLRSGAHRVPGGITGDILPVGLDGNLILPAGDSLSSTGGVLPAFTGATGALTDAHTVTGTSITATKYES